VENAILDLHYDSAAADLFRAEDAARASTAEEDPDPQDREVGDTL
jgi:hypothetical protein